MGEPARVKVDIDDFVGLQDTIDPRDPPPGAALRQENLALVKQGELRVRRGYLLVTFES